MTELASSATAVAAAGRRRTPAREPVAELVRLAADAQAGCSRREARARRPALRGGSEDVRPPATKARLGGEEDDADDVGEPRRPSALERALPEARRDELEVGEAGQAAAPAGSARRRAAPPRGRGATTASRSPRASARTPITAWLKRGARASITVVSRYGSAAACAKPSGRRLGRTPTARGRVTRITPAWPVSPRPCWWSPCSRPPPRRSRSPRG